MEDRADTLRRRIAYYTRCLHEGVLGRVAIIYLHELEKARAELAAIAPSPPKPGDPDPPERQPN